MIICHCFGVNHKQIENCVKEGACTLKDIQKACKACTKCGSCKKGVVDHLTKVIGTLPVLQE